jgi:hypothetical protein
MPDVSQTHARRRGVLLVGVMLVSLCGRAAADPCADGRLGRIELTADGLRVAETTAQSLRPGDFLIQINGHRLWSCAHLADALNEAGRDDLATLLLIRRDGATEVALVTAPPGRAAVDTPVRVAAAPAAASADPVEPATVARALSTALPPSPAPTVPPLPLSRADADAIRDFVAKLMAFGTEVQSHQPLPKAQPWAQRVDRLRQDYNTERGRGVAVDVVEPVLGYYETIAQILLYKENATRERREVRARSEVVLEYHTNSPVGAWFQRYPFLRTSVIHEPEVLRFIAAGESNGQWLPDRAIALLVEYALSAGAVLSATMGATAG